MFRKLCHALLFLGFLAFLLPEFHTVHAQSGGGSRKSASTSKKSGSSKKSSAKPTPDPSYTPTVFDGAPVIERGSVLVFDAVTGRTIYQRNADELRPPASTQKLLTALIVIESGNLDKPMVIQHSDTLAEPTKLYLKAGERYTRRQLLEALLVRSFNDVAVALARDNAGSIEAFAAKMNRRAAELGMRNSHFVNPNGLPAKGQLSTARDMAKLARAAYGNETIRSIVAMKTLAFRRANGKVSVFKNTNRVLRGWPYCNGMKTGYTMASGHCLISSARANGREVIAVVLGNNRQIWQDSCSLLNWGLRH